MFELEKDQFQELPRNPFLRRERAGDDGAAIVVSGQRGERLQRVFRFL